MRRIFIIIFMVCALVVWITVGFMVCLAQALALRVLRVVRVRKMGSSTPFFKIFSWF